MIEEQKPDAVIVTSIDRTHHKYIVRASFRRVHLYRYRHPKC
jgi:predicted dehydrogenase